MSIPPKGARVYFLAICGTGMSALAGLLQERGYVVAGSDVAAYPPVGELLKKLSIPVHLGYDVEDLQSFAPDYVVIGNFIRRDNPQAQYVLQKGIPYGSFPSTLENFFLQDTTNIVVAGTHGKTTTTSCAAFLLDAVGRDPSFLVGGVPLNFEKSFHVGKGREFVIEGDEYDTAFFDKESKFLHYRPVVGIINSMEFDHADIFANSEAMENMFRKFIRLVSASGVLLYCRDWQRVHELIAEEKAAGGLRCIVKSYGFHVESDVRIEDFSETAQGLSFSLNRIVFSNDSTGRYNAQNYAAAILAAEFAGVSLKDLAKVLPNFKGVKRRQEVVGRVGGHLVIDDFAHHPTAVAEVLRGLRAKYPGHRIMTFFEPRSNTSRRNILQAEFERAFDGSDLTVIAEVFKSDAIPADQRLNLAKIVEAHRVRGRTVLAGVTPEVMLEEAVRFSQKGDALFVVLSNGSFDGLHQKLISVLKNS